MNIGPFYASSFDTQTMDTVPYGTEAWSDTISAAAVDASYAICELAMNDPPGAKYSQLLYAFNFGVDTIVPGDTINSITISIRRSANADSAFRYADDARVAWGVDALSTPPTLDTHNWAKAGHWPTSDATETYVINADLPTVEQLLSDEFLVGVQTSQLQTDEADSIASVDAIWISAIDYTPAATGSAAQVILMGSDL